MPLVEVAGAAAAVVCLEELVSRVEALSRSLSIEVRSPQVQRTSLTLRGTRSTVASVVQVVSEVKVAEEAKGARAALEVSVEIRLI